MSHQPLTQALYNRIEDDEGATSVVKDPIDVYEKDDNDEGIIDVDTVNKELSQVSPVNKPKPVTKVVTKPSSVNSEADDDGYQTYNKKGRLIKKPNRYL